MDYVGPTSTLVNLTSGNAVSLIRASVCFGVTDRDTLCVSSEIPMKYWVSGTLG